MIRRHPHCTPRSAISVLSLVVVAGVLTGCGSGENPADGEAAGTSSPAATAGAGADSQGGEKTSPSRSTSVKPSATPTPTEVEYSGSGEWEYAHEAEKPDGEGAPIPIAIRVEKGLPIDLDETAQFVMKTLRDPRGWEPLDHVSFELVPDESQASAVVSVSSPGTTDELCSGLTTNGYTSCRVGGVVAINANRWLGATSDFSDVTVYRQYVINHEVGHAIGHDHEYCPGPGRPAPVMQQQTLGMQGCTVNPWPAVR